MNRYSASSRSKLNTCDPLIIQVMEAVLPHQDHTIVEGARTLARQEELVRTGKSKTMNSRHVVKVPGDLSRAVDVMPYPFTWEFEGALWKAGQDGDREEYRRILHWIQRWARFAGFVEGTARAMGIRLRWGGDWDGDLELGDQTFDDWPHFELIG